MKEKLSNGLLEFAGKLQSQRHMTAVKNAFTSLLPIIIGGSFCTLILNVVLSTTTPGLSVAKIPGLAWLETLSPIFSAANYATMNFIAIGLVILLAIELGKSRGHTEYIVPVVALSSYITLCATFVLTKDASGEMIKVANVLSSQFTGAQGLFMGMLVAIIATEIYCVLVDSKKLEIRMPDSVPSNVTKAFNVLIPAAITILIISTIGFLFQTLTGLTVFEAINTFIQTPLKSVLTGLPGYLLIFFISTFLWTLGIHGSQVLKPVFEATMLLAITENSEAVLAGLQPQNILNTSFVNTFTVGTGAGITGALIIAIFIASKKDDERAIAKLSLVPALFNINETMIFGLPIVLNPIYMIPFMLAPVVSASFAYFMTKIGFATIMSYNIPWTTPVLMKSFLATGGHLGTVITEFLAIVLCVLVYLPFVYIANKQKTKANEVEVNHATIS